MTYKKHRFTIITVVYNDAILLEKTIKSVLSQKFQDYQYIVIDGNSTDNTKHVLKKFKDQIDIILSEPDKGIYHAMNKALKLSEGRGNIFLNAGDIFSGQILSNDLVIPSLIDVYFKNIVSKKFKKKNYTFYKMGMPYCHQGIIFENKNIMYDTNYKISSDYDFYLRHRYKNKLKFSTTEGYIKYDNEGISANQYKIRDKEAAEIIKKNFGIFWKLIFYIKVKIKNFFRKIFYQ